MIFGLSECAKERFVPRERDYRTFHLCIVQEGSPDLAPPFVQYHANHFPGLVTVVHGFYPSVNGQGVLSQKWLDRAFRKVRRNIGRKPWEWELTSAYLKVFQKMRPDAVLAEFGTVAVRVMEACRIANIPLIAHFHGRDASEYSVLEENRDLYQELFIQAASVVVVSHAMQNKLASLGAPITKLIYNPYGVDCSRFGRAKPKTAPAVFLSVGRFVEKKAPHYVIESFACARRHVPGIQLRMIGDGPLLESSFRLVEDLQLGDAVKLLGRLPHETIESEMRHARAFVQHSITASNGDSEGTPNAILEAGASGLPVVSTFHGGIPEVVENGLTGFLVREGDVSGMSKGISRLARDPELAQHMGEAARKRITGYFDLHKSLERLWRIIFNASNVTASRL